MFWLKPKRQTVPAIIFLYPAFAATQSQPELQAHTGADSFTIDSVKQNRW